MPLSVAVNMRRYGVLWDVENLAYQGRLGSYMQRVEVGERLGRLLPVFMRKAGFLPDLPWHLSFARPHLPAVFKRIVREAGFSLELVSGGHKNRADGMFKKALRRGSLDTRPPLPQLMCVITGDSDFFSVIRRLRTLRCRVWVLNSHEGDTGACLHAGRGGVRGADRFVSFEDVFQMPLV